MVDRDGQGGFNESFVGIAFASNHPGKMKISEMSKCYVGINAMLMWMTCYTGFILPANAKQNVTSHGCCFRSECFTVVEHSSTVANYLLQICDVNIFIAFSITESTDRA